MDELDVLMGCIGFLFIGLILGYRWGWLGAMRKFFEDEKEVELLRKYLEDFDARSK